MTSKEFDYPPITFESHSCDACGEQFLVACSTQLQEKLETHKRSCLVKKIVNKKRERTKQHQQHRIALYVHDITIARIQQYNFDRLVRQGVFING